MVDSIGLGPTARRTGAEERLSIRCGLDHMADSRRCQLLKAVMTATHREPVRIDSLKR